MRVEVRVTQFLIIIKKAFNTNRDIHSFFIYHSVFIKSFIIRIPKFLLGPIENLEKDIAFKIV